MEFDIILVQSSINFWATSLHTTKAACPDDIGHAICGQLPVTPLGAPLACFAICFAIKSKVLRKYQEPPRTDKNQKLTNANLRTTHYSTPSTKLGSPRRTLPTIRGRRCSRRMAHSDKVQAKIHLRSAKPDDP